MLALRASCSMRRNSAVAADSIIADSITLRPILFSIRPSTGVRERCIYTAAAVVAAACVISAQTIPAPQEPLSLAIEPAALDSPISGSEPDLPQQAVATEPTSGPVVEEPTSANSELSSTPRRFHLHLELDADFSYDDNITLVPTDKISASFLRIGANVTLSVGDVVERQENYLRLDYTPNLFLYLNDSQYDSLDHLLHLEGYYRFARLSFTVGEDIQSTENSTIQYISTSGGFTPGANIDVSRRQRLNSFYTRASAAYQLGARTAVNLSGSYMTTDFDELINSDTITGSLGLDYEYGPKTTLGIAATIGENLVDPPSPDQTFEQLNLRGSYHATAKLSGTASVGVEFRQFQNDTGVDPIFQTEVQYAPFDGTIIRFAASRQITNSATIADQDYAATQFAVSVSQRMLRRFTVVVTGGYENLTYFSTISGSEGDRTDNYFFIEPALNASITRFWEAGAYYRHRGNQSSLETFTFDENQVGIHTSFKF
jgi:hypothetical protein